MWVNLFKIFKTPRIGAVVGGVVVRGVAAIAATRRASPPEDNKTAIPLGVAVVVAVVRGMAAEAATLIPYDYSYIH